MSKLRSVAGLALMLAAMTGGALTGITSAGAQGEPIRVDETGGRWAFVDLDGDGRTDTGDRFTGRSQLVDPISGEQVGRSFADCIATTRIVVERSKGTWVCTRVLALAGGHIILQGEDPAGFRDGEPYFLAVTGGTGSYSDARGEAEAVDVSDLGTELTIHLEP
jgi:hypothetical protein